MSTLRIRSIHHDAFRSRKLAQLSPAAERCWWRLQCACDDDGRVEDEPDVLASVLFQVMREVTAKKVDAWLQEMADVGLIVRYQHNGCRYLCVVRWHDFQKPRRPLSSKLPPPPVGPRRDASVVVATEQDGDVQEGLGTGAELETEGESEGEGSRRRSSQLAGKAQAIAERLAGNGHNRLSVVAS